MGKIHERAHRDLYYCLTDTNRFGDDIELISPSGSVHELSASVFYSQTETDPDGFKYVVNKPMVMIELAQLSAVPAAGENWIVRIPITKGVATLSSFTIGEKPIVDKTFGMVTLKLNKVEQSE